MASSLVSALWKIPKTRQVYVWLGNVRNSHCFPNGFPSRPLLLHRETTLFKIKVPFEIKVRKIQVTSPRRALPPALLLLLRPLVKIMTIVTGRIIRKWWRKLSPEEKKMVWGRIRKRRKRIAAVAAILFVAFLIYYVEHIVETPLTKRKRFIMFGEDSMKLITDAVYDVQVAGLKSYYVPKSHPFYQRTLRVCSSLLLSNADIPELRNRDWSLIVVDRPDMVNAFCCHNGVICIFTGILNVCTNDDQLAIVISHEIAHAIMDHVKENISQLFLVDLLLLIPSFICWILFSDSVAIMSQWVTRFLTNIMVQLPYSRKLEREADMVGLHLAAKACFDVREASIFWEKMSKFNKDIAPPEWLSTHPSDETRQKELSKLMPGALKLRLLSHCPRLRGYK